MKYYKIENERFVGFYSNDMHEITDDMIEISDEKWSSLLEEKGEIKYKNGELINYTSTRDDNIADGIITLDTEKEKARDHRLTHFQALDLYDKAVLRGDIQETLDMKSQRDIYRQQWLDLPSTYTDITIPIEQSYPIMPNFIEYFA